jgi:hypothetical protein
MHSSISLIPRVRQEPVEFMAGREKTNQKKEMDKPALASPGHRASFNLPFTKSVKMSI